jgi:hypothetical protein
MLCGTQREQGMQSSRYQAPSDIPNQPEDTRSELLLKSQKEHGSAAFAGGAKSLCCCVSACRFGITKASKRCLASKPFISR